MYFRHLKCFVPDLVDILLTDLPRLGHETKYLFLISVESGKHHTTVNSTNLFNCYLSDRSTFILVD